MLVIADENMPHAETFFSDFGEVRLVSGRGMTAETVRDADLLMVRSVTKVNRKLLDGSRVRFVGTATIGTDHVDLEYLKERGIAFASAPGCNAESVAQYMAAAMLSTLRGRKFADLSIGIVGVGNCGKRVERVARALGMHVVLNDPPLARQTGEAKYRPLEELLDCDYLALHVPLTREGEDATWNLINEAIMQRARAGAFVINACRGGVVDEAALMRGLGNGKIGGAILDAWEGEPNINPEMLDRVQIGTPHIAGYSHDGKVNGTRMIHEAACRALGREARAVQVEMPQAGVSVVCINAQGRSFEDIIGELVSVAYPIKRDDGNLREAVRKNPQAIGPAFDALRKNYPVRREFEATTVRIEGATDDWLDRIRNLGFNDC